MLAAAKINLDLRIIGRRDDGFHLLDSIVVFADIGDQLTAVHSDGLSLQIGGQFSAGLPTNDDNLILRSARLMCEHANVKPNLSFKLEKNLPISSGIGGGSADAAAALKLCNTLLDINFDDEKLDKIALKIGADVPVCLKARASRMCGIGEEISPIEMENDLYLLLVNPGVSISTPEIFKVYKMLDTKFEPTRSFSTDKIHLPLMIDELKSSR